MTKAPCFIPYIWYFAYTSGFEGTGFRIKRIIYQCIYNVLCQVFVQDMKRTSSHRVGSLIPVRNTGEAVTLSGALL